MPRSDRSRQVGTLIVAVLISGFNLFYFDGASADITIDGESVHVETDGYLVRFDKGVMNYIHNKHTDTTYTLDLGDGKAGVTGLLHHRYFWKDVNTLTHRSTLISAALIDRSKAELLFGEEGTEVLLTIAIDLETDDLLIDMEGVSETSGVVGMQWGCSYLDNKNLSVIVPMDGGRVFDASVSSGLSVSAPYPFSSLGWEAQLAIVQDERGGFYIRNTDNTLQFKYFVYDHFNPGGGDGFGLNFGTHNQAPFDSHTTATSQLWRFNTYAGDWRVPARRYRDWMEQAFQPKRLSDLGWVEDITLFVGSARSTIWLTHTEFFDALATQVDPTKTIVMVRAWSNPQPWSIHPDNHHPIYEPKAELQNFIDAGRKYGFRLILYADMHAFSTENPLYPEFMQYQYRDPWTGELLGWRWDTTHPHRNAQMNPASSAFRELLVSQLQPVWEAYDIDGFFLDTSFYAINDANGLIDGLNSAQGGALLHKELAEAMPGAIFVGERLHEGTFAYESFAQLPHHVEGEMEPHPISTFLFSPFTHAISYAYVNPDENPVEYQRGQRFDEVREAMPTLNAWDARQLTQPEYVGTQNILAMARGWRHWYGMNGDVNGDGIVNILDLTLVGQNVGIMPLTHLQTDINGDGAVDVMDLILVSNMFDAAR